jgi:hypothetical protein
LVAPGEGSDDRLAHRGAGTLTIAVATNDVPPKLFEVAAARVAALQRRVDSAAAEN